MKRVICCLPIILLAGNALAAVKYQETRQAAFLLDYAKGADYARLGIGLGLGAQVHGAGFGGAYYENLSFGHSDMNIQSLGVRGFKTQGNTDSDMGADLMLALSQTTLTSDKQDSYKRTGLSGRAVFHVPVWGSVTAFLGAELRPEWLSFNWDSAMFAEVGFVAGEDWRLQDNLSIYLHYHYQGMLNGDMTTQKLSSGSVVGLHWVW